MKLVYCIPSIYNSGGMERVLSVKANYLADSGHDIYIITTDQKGRNPFFNFSDKIRIIDIGVNYEEMYSSGIFKKALSFIKKKKEHRQKLTEILSKIKPDITISMYQHEYSFLYQIKDGSKKVIESHFNRYVRFYLAQNLIDRTTALIRYWHDIKILSKYDKFVVLTEEDAGYWRLSNTLVIPNPSTIYTGDKQSLLKDKRIISVGRITRQKGYDRLLKVWETVMPILKDWELVIIGNTGDAREVTKLQNIIKSRKLLNVSIVPPVSNIEREYLRSSLFVMTSRYEGLPLVMIEAMSYGLPCISLGFKCGPKDLISNNIDGVVIQDSDLQAMSEAIISVVTDTDKLHFMGDNAKKKAQVFAIDNIMHQWEELFKTIVN